MDAFPPRPEDGGSDSPGSHKYGVCSHGKGPAHLKRPRLFRIHPSHLRWCIDGISWNKMFHDLCCNPTSGKVGVSLMERPISCRMLVVFVVQHPSGRKSCLCPPSSFLPPDPALQRRGTQRVFILHRCIRYVQLWGDRPIPGHWDEPLRHAD